MNLRLFFIVTYALYTSTLVICRNVGDAFFDEAESFSDEGDLISASNLYWKAVLYGPGKNYSVETAFKKFVNTYAQRGMEHEAYLYIGKEYIGRKQITQGLLYLEEALKMNERIVEAHQLLAQYLPSGSDEINKKKLNHLQSALDLEPKNAKTYHIIAHLLFELRQWEPSLQHLNEAYRLDTSLTDAVTNAIFLRTYIAKWGSKSGKQYWSDMKIIEKVIKKEIATTMKEVFF